MSKQRRRVDSEVNELPGVQTPTQKQGTCVQALCLSHSAEGLLLSVCMICDFRVVLPFTTWNASDLWLTSEVMQPWGNTPLPVTDQTDVQDGSLCPWALHLLKICRWVVTVRSHPLCWGRGSRHSPEQRVSSQPGGSVLAWAFSSLSTFFFGLWRVFFFPLVSRRKNARGNLFK